ncbi:MAG: discoidin domain-containing protein [Verrucomicrobiales bacterium]
MTINPRFPAALAACSVALFLPRADGANIAFGSASVTFQQGPPFQIPQSIDTLTTGPGWAVDGGQHSPQTAVFTTTAPASGSEWAFTLHHNPGFGDHHTQEFRLAYTTDGTPSLGGTWSSISPTSFKSTNGVTLANVGADTLRATGAAGWTSYQVRSTAPLNNVTGFRLELFPFDYNPADGLPASLGRAPNGNFVVSEFTADTSDTINRAFAGSATGSSGTWPGFPPSNLTDGNNDSLTHPDSPQNPGAYNFTIDLGEHFNLTAVDLRNRTDGCCPERLSNYRVEILDPAQSPVWSGDIRTDGSNSGVNGLDVITAGMGTGTFSGQFVRITNLGGGNYSPQIGEVRAFGMPVPEPSILLFTAASALAFLRRRR